MSDDERMAAALRRVAAMEQSHGELLVALKRLIEAGEFAVTSTDDIAIMLRLGVATDAARAAIKKAEAI